MALSIALSINFYDQPADIKKWSRIFSRKNGGEVSLLCSFVEGRYRRSKLTTKKVALLVG